MSFTYDGQSLVYNGTVTIGNFVDPTNGVVTLTLTPAGGFGSLPALAAGTPGLPPVLTFVSVPVAYGTTPPAPTTTVTNAGGPGVASQVTVTFYVANGAPGTNGTNGTLAGCSDLTGTAVVGEIPMVTGTGPTAFQYTAFPFGNIVNPSSYTSLSQTGQVSATLCSVAVPAQTFDWYPVCLGNCVVAGTVNTVVNIQALLNNPSTGNQVGIAYGVAGVPNQVLTMSSGFGSLISGGYGLVEEGASATIYFNAVEIASTADSWSISNTKANFQVLMVPVA